MALARSGSIVFAISLLALAACGGSSKQPDAASDLALANAAVLNGADLPGYVSSPHTNADETPSAILQTFDSCLKVPATLLDPAPGEQKVNAADFSMNSQNFVTGAVEIDAQQSDIDNGYDALSRTGTESCFEEYFREAVKVGITESQGIGFGPVAVDRFDPGVGDKSTGYAVKISATDPNAATTLFVDFLFVAHDRAGIELEFFANNGTPIDRSFETGLAQKVYDRIGDKAK